MHFRATSLRLLDSASCKYRKLGLFGKVVVWSLVFFYGCMIAFIILVTPRRIAQFTYDIAQQIHRLPYGSLILMAAVVTISFPPFIGHTTLMNIFGFTYGMQGFFPAAVSTIMGSAVVFVTLRHLFSRRLPKWASTNDNWKALESVVRSRGLPLIILIRISPFPPWVYSNSLFASIEAVSFTQFVVATCFVLPRVLVYVFIGSRIASLSDGEQRNNMDTQTKFINSLVVLGGVLISLVASSILYRFVQKEVEALRTSPSVTDDNTIRGIEEPEDAPLLAQHPTETTMDTSADT